MSELPVPKSDLTVREMTLAESLIRIDYFHTATDEFLERIGVDRARLPSRDEWHSRYKEDLARSLPERQSHALVWLLSQTIVGFSTADRIEFGNEAFMHLHMLSAGQRGQGLGTQFVRRSAAHYFTVLKLEQLHCEPNALNEAPNRILQRAGFRYVRTHVTTPGPLNFEQPVTRWSIRPEALESSASLPAPSK